MLKKSDLKPGAVLCSHWGYNCSRWSFYAIKKVTDKSVYLSKTGKQYVSGAPNWPCAEVAPVLSSVSDEVITRRIGKGYDGEDSVCIKISDHEYCNNLCVIGKTYSECCD